MPPRNTARLLLLLERDALSARIAIQWATDALVDDFDSPALRRVAGVDPKQATAPEIAPDLNKALNELGIARGPLPDLFQRYELEICAAMVAGEIPPVVGASDLYHSVVIPTHYEWRFVPWYFLDDGLDPYDPGDCQPVPGMAMGSSILRYAKEVVECNPHPTQLARAMHARNLARRRTSWFRPLFMRRRPVA